MTDCLFCKIASGAIPAARVGENDQAFAFLDIQPLSEGHALVIPKKHAARLHELAPADRDGLWRLVHDLTPRLQKTVGGEGMTVAVNDGAAAGQEVPHVHVHLVPRTTGDGHGPIHALFGGGKQADPEHLKAIQARL